MNTTEITFEVNEKHTFTFSSKREGVSKIFSLTSRRRPRMQLKKKYIFVTDNMSETTLKKQRCNPPVDCVLSFISTCYPTQRCKISKELTPL